MIYPEEREAITDLRCRICSRTFLTVEALIEDVSTHSAQALAEELVKAVQPVVQPEPKLEPEPKKTKHNTAVGTVWVCNKVGYPSKTQALKVMEAINKTREPGEKKEKRAYLCPYCRYWHLSGRRDWAPYKGSSSW